MAEILGALASGLTIATLFKGCIEAFDLVQSARHQESDLNSLVLKFNIEKCRLFLWGQVMGLTAQANPRERHPLEDLEMQDLVCETLQAILAILQSTWNMKEKYGCKEMPDALRNQGLDPQAPANDIENLATAFSHFRITKPCRDNKRTMLFRARWVIHDRKKFNELIKEARGFITSLHAITASLFSVKVLEDRLRDSVQRVGNPDTLQHIADITETDYPNLSDAASSRADTLTTQMNERMAIEAWMDDVGQAFNNDDTEPIENLTTTDLKHLVMATRKSELAATDFARTRSRPNSGDHFTPSKFVQQRIAIPSGDGGRIGPEDTYTFEKTLKIWNVALVPSELSDSRGAAIKSFELGDLFQETEEEKIYGNRLWFKDLMTLGSNYSEAKFQRTMMMNLLDRTSVIFEKEINGQEILNYSIEDSWHTLPMSSLGILLEQPKPDLAICFNRQALIRDDLWKGLPTATGGLAAFENPFSSNIFHFFILEAADSATSLEDPKNLYRSLHSASQALYNFYEFFQDAGPEHKQIFFDRVRFFSAVANAHGILIRVHRAIEIPPYTEVDRLSFPERPEYRLQYEYEEFSRLTGDDFRRDPVVETMRKVSQYAVNELSVCISEAAEDLVNQLHQNQYSTAFKARTAAYYRYGQPSSMVRKRPSVIA